MARPGFVLQVDDRTPPLVVPAGDGFRRERLPAGARVVYPAEPPAPLPDLAAAVDAALDAPLDSAPLSGRLRAGMRLTVAFADSSTPVPPMAGPDVRGTVLEAVLDRAARAGVDDVVLLAANGLRRRMTDAELQRLLGERVHRSFAGSGLLAQHDATDPEQLTALTADVSVNARAAAADLLVHVHLVTGPEPGGATAVAAGLGGTDTVRAVSLAVDGPAAEDVAEQVAAALPIFSVTVVLAGEGYPRAARVLGRREWEWGLGGRAVGSGLQVALPRLPRAVAARLLRGPADWSATGVHAGAPAAVAAASREQVLQQQVVSVPEPADVGVLGVPAATPYSGSAPTNPVLAAWQGLVETLGSHTGRPFVRPGGALILHHPLTPQFSPLQHPSFVDFFDTVLTRTTDPAEMAADEDRFAADPWYAHLHRTSQAYPGVLPFVLWRQVVRARASLGDVVWVGADRGSAARLGFRAASTLADALEIVHGTVGGSPSVSYLHSPPRMVVDLP